VVVNSGWITSLVVIPGFGLYMEVSELVLVRRKSNAWKCDRR